MDQITRSERIEYALARLIEAIDTCAVTEVQCATSCWDEAIEPILVVAHLSDEVTEAKAALAMNQDQQDNHMTDQPQASLKTVVGKLCKCGAPAGEPRPCPFRSDIHGNREPCDCCDNCRTECARDV